MTEAFPEPEPDEAPAPPPKPVEIHHKRTEAEVGVIYRLLGLTPTGSKLTLTLVLPAMPPQEE